MEVLRISISGPCASNLWLTRQCTRSVHEDTRGYLYMYTLCLHSDCSPSFTHIIEINTVLRNRCFIYLNITFIMQALLYFTVDINTVLRNRCFTCLNITFIISPYCSGLKKRRKMFHIVLLYNNSLYCNLYIMAAYGSLRESPPGGELYQSWNR